ncbi:MAG: M81 family metallopeptidase [Marinovum sp.]|mgnify:FL=1|nr:M81 family metallopeptidase [Marinovum sp.]MBT6531622.1 M81 family metallopeptidase [Marinovum sp.]MBT7906417.1 M81 family metallopeptidase [Marinovum sp.]
MTNKAVLLAGLFHETHTFLHHKTGLDEFRAGGLNLGQDVVSNNVGNGSPTDGFLEHAKSEGWNVIPAVQMAANPSGTVSQDVIDVFYQNFFQVFERECTNIDGIFLVLHGAMVSEEMDDVEGQFLKDLHGRLTDKGTDIPVAAVIDFHANVSKDMTDFSTCLYSYRMNPHSDARDAAVQGAVRLGALMNGRKVTQHHLATRYIVPPTGLATASNPMKSVQARARAIEAQDPDILCINVMGGYSYADIKDCGFSLNCCTSGEKRTALGYLDDLLAVFEADLAKAYPREASLTEILHRIDAKPRGHGPILLVEPADNIGGGTPGDGTGLLAPLLATGRKNIVAVLNDPEAAAHCNTFKLRDPVTILIGAKLDAHHGLPIEFSGTIRNLSDGRFELENKNSHLASMMGTHINMGACAVLENDQAIILLTSRKTPPMDLGQLHSQGIRPEDAELLIVKAAVSHRDAYDPIASASYNVESIGLCTSDLGSLPYRNIVGKQLSAATT